MCLVNKSAHPVKKKHVRADEHFLDVRESTEVTDGRFSNVLKKTEN
jgi:hypothetical protein